MPMNFFKPKSYTPEELAMLELRSEFGGKLQSLVNEYLDRGISRSNIANRLHEAVEMLL